MSFPCLFPQKSHFHKTIQTQSRCQSTSGCTNVRDYQLPDKKINYHKIHE